MLDRFLSQNIVNASKNKYYKISKRANSSSTPDTGTASSSPPSEDEIVLEIKNSLDAWTTLANTAGSVTTGTVVIPSIGDMPTLTTEQITEQEQSVQGYGALIGLILSVIAAFIWYVRKKMREDTDYHAVKKELNSWYARFTVASQACQNIATVAFSFIPPIFAPLKRVLSYVTGTLAGLITVLLIRDDPKKENPLFILGNREGWSSYMYTGGSIGGLVGSAIGALIGLLIPLPFTMPVGIAIGGAIGGLLGSIGTGIGVPIINKIFPEADTAYRLNYAKTGALLGSTLGGIIGFIVGFFIPLPGAVIACTAIGMGIGAGIGSITLAATGSTISKNMSQDGDSSWDYNTRYAGTIGDGFGKLVGFGFEHLQEGAQQLAANIGTLITCAIGFCYDRWTAYRQRNQSPAVEKQQTGNETSVPWSQRINVFAAVGTACGSVIGFFIGGPVGMIAGGATGALLGGIVGLTFGDPICKKVTAFGNWLTKKVEYACCSSSPKDTCNSPQLQTHAALLAKKKSNPNDSCNTSTTTIHSRIQLNNNTTSNKSDEIENTKIYHNDAMPTITQNNLTPIYWDRNAANAASFTSLTQLPKSQPRMNNCVGIQ